MPLTRNQQIALAVASILSIAGLAAAALSFVAGSRPDTLLGRTFSFLAPQGSDFPAWAFLLMIALIWTTGVYIVYIVHIVRNPRIGPGARLNWVLVALLGHLLWPLNILVLLEYWRREIWGTHAAELLPEVRH